MQTVLDAFKDTVMRWKGMRAVLAATTLVAAGVSADIAVAQSGRLVIGSVNNGEFVALKELLPEFNRLYPDIEVEFQLIPENEVRAKITTDVTTQSGIYDLITTGPYEVPMWGKAGWLEPLDAIKNDPAYQVNDIFPAYLDALSYDGKLYAAPGSAQASMLYYRKDLLDAAGLKMPEAPTWDQVVEIASKLHDPASGLYGMCLRGLPGWGQMGAPLGTVINTFGGRWYDADWNAQITSPETSAAIKFYIKTLQTLTPPGVTQFGNQECGQAITTGQAAMLYDDSSWAQVFFDPKTNPHAKNMAVAMAPVKEAGSKPSAWFWTWAWAVPKSAHNKEAALAFIKWVTGPDYIPYAAPIVGWGRMPGPARASQYEPGSAYSEFATPFMAVLKKTLATVDGVNGTHYDDTPYRGNQYVQNPEFQDLGNRCTQEFAGAVVGQQTPDEAIAKCQQYAEEVAVMGGYR
ncbi:MAG: sugar ABC transporter substrate-binding protein [Alphaproteobacteria bacterium]|nr:MAG: sugar ABC transporter substrate-binding protein [Alphaproteobacteria bacterium]